MAQRGEVTCSRSHSEEALGLGSKPMLSDSKSPLLTTARGCLLHLGSHNATLGQRKPSHNAPDCLLRP